MDNKKNHHLYKREYKKTLNPTILNSQENGSLLNKMDTRNQIAHLNSLNDLYLNSNQKLTSLPEENYYYQISHENNFNRIVNLSYDKKICQICQVYNVPVPRSNSELTVQKMQKYDTTKVFAEKIQLITPLPNSQPKKISIGNHTNIQAIEYVPKNRKNTAKPTSVPNKNVPSKKTSSHLPPNYSPEIPKLPSKKASPSKEQHMRPVLMSSPKADISRKIQQQNFTENDHFNQDFSNGIQAENTNSSSLFSINTNKTAIPPAPPMDNSLLGSFKNANEEKQQQVPFESVMDELKYKLEKRKIKCDEGAPKSTPNDKRQAKAESSAQIESEIDHLLTRIKDYKFENAETTSTMKCQAVVVSESPTTSSDLALKNVLNKIKINDVPKHSEKCVIKTVSKVPSPDPPKFTPPSLPKTNGVKRSSVLAMAKYFEESFKPKEIKIVRKKPKIVPIKNLKITPPIESGRLSLPSDEKLIKPKEKPKTVADKTEERTSRTTRPKSMCEKSLLNEQIDYDNEKSEVSEVRPVFLNELPNHSRQSLAREKSDKYRNRSQSSTNYNRLHDVNSKFRPVAYLRNPAEFTAPIYSEEARDYYNKGIYKLDFKKESPIDRNASKVDYLPRIEYLNDFSNYLQKKPVNGLFYI